MNPFRSAALAGVLFAAIAIPLSAVRPLWLDEILQLIETRRPSTVAMVESLRQTPGAAPLGYILQRAFLRIGGYSRAVERLPAALFGAGAVFIVGVLGTKLGLRKGWQAAGIFAVFPMMLRYATESRVYSQALFFPYWQPSSMSGWQGGPQSRSRDSTGSRSRRRCTRSRTRCAWGSLTCFGPALAAQAKQSS